MCQSDFRASFPVAGELLLLSLVVRSCDHSWLGHVHLTVHRSPGLCGNLGALEDLDISFKAQSIYLLGVCRFLKSVSIYPKIFLNIFLPFLCFHPLVSSASSSPSSFLAAQPTLIWV